MYRVDDRDKVIELRDLPQCSTGAPCPIVLAAEHALIVAYFVESVDPEWDGTSARMVGPNTRGEPAALVMFSMAKASMFGPPNDEAFTGHPLASRGLRPYGAFEVLDSSWIRVLESMNAVHPSHRPEHYSAFRHFVLSFHDTTFECVARGYSTSLVDGSVTAAIAGAVRDLDGDA